MKYSNFNHKRYGSFRPQGKGPYSPARYSFSPLRKIDRGYGHDRLLESFRRTYPLSNPSRPRIIGDYGRPRRRYASRYRSYGHPPISQGVPIRPEPISKKLLTDIEPRENQEDAEQEKTGEAVEKEKPEVESQEEDIEKDVKDDASLPEVEPETESIDLEPGAGSDEAAENEGDAVGRDEIETDAEDLETPQDAAEDKSEDPAESYDGEILEAELEELETAVCEEIEKNQNLEEAVEPEEDDDDPNLDAEKNGGLENIIYRESDIELDMDTGI